MDLLRAPPDDLIEAVIDAVIDAKELHGERVGHTAAGRRRVRLEIAAAHVAEEDVDGLASLAVHSAGEAEIRSLRGATVVVSDILFGHGVPVRQDVWGLEFGSPAQTPSP